jgi:uncharacterized RDD family membrane protein YckC
MENVKYAGLFRRMFALTFDIVILLLLNILLYILLQKIGFRVSPEQENPLVSILLLLVNWYYFVYFETSKWQGTPGKMALKMQVGSEDGGIINFGQATQRFVFSFLTVFTFFIGYFIAWRDNKRQTVHDRLSRTYVFLKK